MLARGELKVCQTATPRWLSSTQLGRLHGAFREVTSHMPRWFGARLSTVEPERGEDLEDAEADEIPQGRGERPARAGGHQVDSNYSMTGMSGWGDRSVARPTSWFGWGTRGQVSLRQGKPWEGGSTM